MRICAAVAFSCILVLNGITAPTAQAQTDAQHLSAEEFLSSENVPAPAPSAEPSAAVSAAESAATDALFGDNARQREMEDRKLVRLRTIDKLSARTHTFDIPVGKTVKFGKSLFIKPRACRAASPLDEPENAAFLQIWERPPAASSDREESAHSQAHWVFSGWMFSSSPSLSAMEHPIYDVWVIECKNATTSAAAEAYSSEQAPAVAPETAPETTPEPVASPATLTPQPAEKAPTPAADSIPDVPPLQELPGSFEDAE